MIICSHTRHLVTTTPLPIECLAPVKEACLTELNMAVRVSSVVIPIPTRPGTDSGGTNRESQAITTNTGGNNT
jgi:hypothetical protein